MNSRRIMIRSQLGWSLIILTILACFLLGEKFASSAEPKNGYRIEGDGNLLQLTTPYGNQVFFMDPGLTSANGFQVEIPINELKSGSNAVTQPSSTLQEKDPGQLDNTDQLVLKANELYNRGKFNESLTFVEEILRRDARHVRGWIMKGSLLHALGQKDLAKKAWRRAVEIDPNNPQLKAILGRYE